MTFTVAIFFSKPVVYVISLFLFTVVAWPVDIYVDAWFFSHLTR